ncbi:DUF6233 domain-containing protein [Streptomyces lincolnensis]|uniref:DUF6233 domain-containing protein n=1 Tax=Streptomyces lincolnensis TaxID=1915 RepID=UPI001CEF96F1|nr:DUF6233 domain-containing protein [Streptomyces lincolnensis]
MADRLALSVSPGAAVEAAEYRGRVRVPEHVRPVDGVDYDQVVTEKLERSPQAVVREVLGERRPSEWVLAKLHDGRGPARSVLNAPDCEEAPAGALLLDVDRALDTAEHPGTRLCTLCGAAAGASAPRLRPHHRLRPRRLLTRPPHRRRPGAAAPSGAQRRRGRPDPRQRPRRPFLPSHSSTPARAWVKGGATGMSAARPRRTSVVTWADP